MTKQTINIGTSPNKGDGDPLRIAFEKINSNFTELYNSSAVDLTNGFTGSKGSTGFTGSKGNTGFTGSTGVTGSAGFTGSKGIDGFTGSAGSQGETGFTGSAGDTGFTGSQGDIGYTGSKGVDGFTGSQGEIGFTGSQGEIGFTGSQGDIGYTGSKGIDGFTGSAGFTGSKGDIGVTGSAGFDGSQGVVGFTGSQGADGYTGSNGEIGYTGSQGDIGFTGSKGDTGFTGSQGEQGIQGTTGAQGVSVTLQGTKATIAELPTAPVNPNDFSGHGWIVTTGDGITHLDGSLWFWNLAESAWNDIGPIVGPQGDIGFNGSRGDVGFNGSKGDVGFTGSQGETGYTGSTGDVGFTGSAGDTGFTGSQGEIGYTGSQGVPGTSLTGWTVDLNTHFIPNTDNLQDLGTPSNRVRHIYVGPGSITVGSSVITESTTGKLVLPGVTRGLNYTIDEVEEKGDQTYNFTSVPVIVDAAYFDILQQVLAAPLGYQPPAYSVNQLDDGEIDGIDIDSNGAGLDQSVASKMREFMRAYIGPEQDPIANFGSTLINDWIQIPFTVSTEAADVEYEFGGSADLGDFSIDGSELSAEQMTIKTDDGDITIQSDSDVFVKVAGGTKYWSFANDGNITLPEGGDILNNDGSSVLGGGAGTGDWAFNGNVAFNGTDYNQGLYVAPGGESTSFVYVPGNSQSDTVPVRISNGSSSGRVIINSFNKDWEFSSNGAFRLPEGGDILNSSGQSVLGGSSYTPDDLDNWNDPTINTIQTALDELAARVTAIQNFEIDGGNAYTPAAGETVIDGNGV